MAGHGVQGDSDEPNAPRPQLATLRGPPSRPRWEVGLQMRRRFVFPVQPPDGISEDRYLCAYLGNLVEFRDVLIIETVASVRRFTADLPGIVGSVNQVGGP